MNKTIQVAIVGTGGMAHAHARDLQNRRGVKLIAVSDVDPQRAKAFAEKFQVPGVYTDFSKLLKEAPVDAVINVTPDAFHASLSIEAIAAGKHVLCEKPLATNYADAKRMATAAKKKGVINMVNFSYRNSSAVQKAHAMIVRGDIGRPVHFEASYLQSWLSSVIWGDWRSSPGWLWRLSIAHGSKGALGDIGVHILDMADHAMGPFSSVNCRLKTFDKANGGRVGKYKLDANDSAVIHAEMKNGALGVVHITRWATGHGNSLQLRVYGDEGSLVINLDKSYHHLETCLGKDRHKAIWKTLACPKTPNMHERFFRGIKTGKQDQPDFVQGAAIQRVLDACFTSDETGKTVRV
jgi:predicted dehydrogenase